MIEAAPSLAHWPRYTNPKNSTRLALHDVQYPVRPDNPTMIIPVPKTISVLLFFNCYGSILPRFWAKVLIMMLLALIPNFLVQFKVWDPLAYNPLRIDFTSFTSFGVALSVFLGFRNSSCYDRWWEARKIWGALINTARHFGHEVTALYTTPFSQKYDVDHRLPSHPLPSAAARVVEADAGVRDYFTCCCMPPHAASVRPLEGNKVTDTDWCLFGGEALEQPVADETSAIPDNTGAGSWLIERLVLLDQDVAITNRLDAMAIIALVSAFVHALRAWLRSSSPAANYPSFDDKDARFKRDAAGKSLGLFFFDCTLLKHHILNSASLRTHPWFAYSRTALSPALACSYGT